MLTAFYYLKPFIPRSAQLFVRRKMVTRKRRSCEHIWPINESLKMPPEKWSGWPDQKQFALVLTHDVDTEKGQEKCHKLIELEEKTGFRSSFNFVPRRYNDSPELRKCLIDKGFEVGVHGLYHDGKYFVSKTEFQKRAIEINHYLKEWKAVGYRSPSMLHRLDWFHDLNIEYDASTFDTDPFEPQPDGVDTIFPFFVKSDSVQKGYVELPYTLPQDFTLFILFKEKTIDIWKKKIDWIARHGGMVLLNTHPDYMNFGTKKLGTEEYPSAYYEGVLAYVKSHYEEKYWPALPRQVAEFVRVSNPS